MSLFKYLFRQLQTSSTFLLSSFVVALFFFASALYAAPPDSPYAPGETLAPTCSPGSTNCTVNPPGFTSTGTSTTLSTLSDLVGIGTTSPAFVLDIYATTTNGLLRAGTNSNDSLFVLDSTGRLGLGTSSPYKTLSVSGELVVTGSTTFNGVEYLFPGADGSASYVLSTDGAGGLLWKVDLTGSGGSGLFATTSDSLAIIPVDAADVLVIGGSATTTSGYLFEVIGSSLFDSINASSTLVVDGSTNLAGILSVTGASTLANASSTDQDLSGYLVVNGQTTLGNASTTLFTVSGNSYLGTIATGIWNGDTIAEIYGGTGLGTFVIGDILYSDAENSLARLATSSSGSVLQLDLSTGLPSYVATSTLGVALTDTTGTLAVARGGTGSTSPTNFLFGDGAGALTSTSTIAQNFIDSALARIVNVLTLTDWFATTSALHLTTLEGVTSLIATNATTTNATTTNFGLNGETFTDLTGTGLQLTGSALTLNATGDWTGTFDGQQGSYYLDAANLTNFGTPFYTFFNATTTDALSEGSTNKYYSTLLFATDLAGTTTTALSEGTNLYFTDARADARINATSTIGTLTSTPNLAIIGTITSGAWNGTLIGETYGGTGQSTYVIGDILYADAADSLARLATSTAGSVLQLDLSTGLPSYVATSTLGVALTDTTGTLAVGRGGTGSTTPTNFLFGDGAGALTSTSTIAQNFIDSALARIVNVLTLTDWFATTSALHLTTLEGVTSLIATNATTTNATTTNFGLNSETFTDLTGTGLQNTGGALTLNVTGDWTGTFDGQEGVYYLDAANLTNFGTPFYTFFNATNTDALSEGSSNLYYTAGRVAGVIAGTTTDTLSEGSTNKYYSTLLFATDLAATTTDALSEGATNFYFTNNRFDERLSATTTLPNLTTLLGLTNASSTQLTVTGLAYFNSSTTFNGVEYLFPGADGSTNYVLSTNGTGGLSWKVDSTGSGGSGFFSTTTDSLVVYPTDTSDVLVIGGSATTTIGYLFEVIGSALFDAINASSTLTVDGATNLAGILSVIGNTTLTNASSTNQDLSGYLVVTGDTTLSNASTTNITASGYLNITGATTLINASTTNITASGYLTISGNTTLASATSTNLFSTTLGINSEYFTDLTGTGLVNTAGVLTADQATLLFLSDWYATTTDALTEGSTNKYYSTLLFATDLAGTTTTALSEGTNLYWTDTRFDTRLSATTTLPNLTTLLGLTDTITTNATTTNATSTNLFATNTTLTTLTGTDATFTSATTTNFGINSETFTDFTGTGLLNLIGVLTIDQANIIRNWGFDTTYGVSVLTPTTTIPLWAKSALYASSTITADGAVTLGNTLSVTGATTFTNASSTNQDLSGYLVVTGDTTLSNASTTNITASGYLNITGATTLINASTTNITASGYLTVNGNTTLASATSTNLFSTNFGINSEYFTDLTGVGLTLTSGALTVATSTFNLDPSSIDLTTGYTLIGDSSGNASATSSLFVTSAGNVGVGTTSPAHKFTVSEDTASTTLISNLFSLEHTFNDALGGAGIGAGFLFLAEDGSDTSTSTARIVSALSSVSTTSPTSYLSFETKGTTGSLTEALRIDSSGNVGIGTTSPSAQLALGGLLYIGGTGTSTVENNLAILGGLKIGSSSLFLNTNGLTADGRLSIAGTGQITTVQFDVISGDGSNYSFDYDFDGGVDSTDPTITLVRGQTYRFNVTASGHPLELRTSAGGSTYSNGVTNNTEDNGTVTFTVPHDAPSSLVYQCTVHPAMVGNITIISQSVLADGDGDTKIQVEESSDEDVIRFDTAGTERLVITSTGNVGIGTTSPFATLSVAGSGFFNDSLTASNITATGTLSVSGATTLANASSTNQDLSGYLVVTGDTTLGNASTTNITASGYLTVDGNTTLASATSTNLFSTNFGINSEYFTDLTGVGLTLTSGALTVATSTFNLDPSSIDLAQGFTLVGNLSGNASATSTLFITSAGNVGVGTTSPYAKLSVVGEVVSEYFTATSTTATSTFAGGLAIETSGFVYDYSTNRVGIGTAAPSTALDVAGYITALGLQDDDGDTKIQVEESADEDIIRFDLAGTEKWVMQGSRLEPVNTGNSVFIGEGAGANDDLTANKNVAVGFNALNTNTTGQNNTAVGYNALTANTTGQSNFAVGFQALKSNTTGNFNTALGVNALNNNIIGTGNVGIGNLALTTNTGSNNVGIGADALTSNIGGNNNVGIGINALVLNTTASDNTAIGYAALFSNTTGSNNVAIGREAGYSNTGGSSVFIGYQAGYNETAANKLYIDNSNTASPLIYGEFDNDILAINGKLGIGTTTPYSALSVWGSGTGTNKLFELTNSASTTLASFLENGTGYFLGNIGIGTTSPFATLSVAGNSYIDGTLTVTGNSIFANASSTNQDLSGYLVVTGDTTLSNASTTNITASGYLTVDGNTTLASATSTNFYTTNFGLNSEYFTDLTGVGLTLTSGALTVATSTFNLSPSSIDLTQGFTLVGDSSGNASATSTLFISSAGNVGIGTTTPAYKLDVAGSVNTRDALGFSDGTTQQYAATPDGFAWNVTTASFKQSTTTAAQETTPSGVFFKPDGKKMYIVGGSNAVYEYDLTTSWDVSTASSLQSTSTAAQETNLQGIFFRQDGLKMYVIGNSDDDVEEYDLSTAWDVSSASHVQAFDTSSQNSNAQGVFFRPDGKKMFVTGNLSSEDEVNEYTLTTAWDVSTASYNSQTFDAGTNLTEVFFKPDGTRMYLVGTSNNNVVEYILTTAWDTSTAVLSQSFSAPEDGQNRGLFFRQDGSKMYIAGATGDKVYEYDLGLSVGGTFIVFSNSILANASSTNQDLSGYLVVSGDTTLASATSTNLFSTNFGINSEYFTDLTGVGLTLTSGALTVATSTFNLDPSSIDLTQGFTLVGDSTGNASATSSLFISQTGNVAIGTTTISLASSTIAASATKLTLQGGFTQEIRDPVIIGGVASSTALNGVRSVYVSGKYAYVASFTDNSMQIIDISNPTNPSIVGGVKDAAALNGIISVYVSGKYAYVASFNDDSLRIIDISDPTNPSIVGGVKDLAALDAVVSVYVSGTYAYVATNLDDSLRIIDISDPTNPSIVGGVDTLDGDLDGANAVYVSGKYAYVASFNDDSLRIIDISDPTNPSIVGGVQDAVDLDGARSVYVSGKYAYVGNVTDDSLRIIDISDPTNPSIVGGVKDATALDGIRSVYVSGKYAYVANNFDHSLRIIDISDPTNPSIVGGVKDAVALEGAADVYVSGKYAYVASIDDDSLRIIDIGGIDAPSASIGDLWASNLNITDNATIANSLYVGSGLNVGRGGIYSQGALSIYASSTLAGFTLVQDSTGDILNIFDGTTEVFTILDGGNVGIGTTSPSSILTLWGGATGNIFEAVTSASSTALVVNSSGNVGIGTTPSNQLTVQGFAEFNSPLLLSNQGGPQWIGLSDSSARLDFNYRNSTTTGASPIISILDANFGIRNPFAAYALDVAGTIRTGNDIIQTTGGTFVAGVPYPIESNADTVSIGDVNNDGYADLVVANDGVDSVSVFINDGDGTFATKVNYGTGDNPRYVSIGDLNNDGYADLAVPNSTDGDVSVLINDGDGTFATKVDYPTGTSAIFVSIGDVNNDGYADLAVVNNGATSVSILINNGDGTFATKVDYTTGAGPRSVSMGDVNNDGYTDLAVANTTDDDVSVLINNGDGTFATKVDYPTGIDPYSVAIGDVNNDGYADLAVGKWGPDDVSIFINNGDGTFAAKVDYPAGVNVLSVAMGDVNNDGYLDVVAGTWTSNISVFINDGDGTFATEVEYSTVTRSTFVAMGDVNNDGYVDIAVIDTVNNNVFVFINNDSTIFIADRSTGRVGIGTSTPYSVLSVWGGSTGNIFEAVTSASSTAFVINSSGNVGIGTTSPFGLLSVEQGTETASLWIGNTGSSTPSFVVQGVNGNGYVGIGVESPQSLLHLQGDGRDFEIRLAAAGATASGDVGVQLRAGADGGPDFLGLAAGATNKGIIIHTSGNVGIGSTNSSNRLTVFAINESDADVALQATSTAGDITYNWIYGIDRSDAGKFKIASSTALGTNDRFVIDGAGNVGIGTAAPTTELEVVGDITSKGTKWTLRTTPADKDWDEVTYGNGLFVAIGSGGTGNRVMTSPDGVNWATTTSAADNNWRGLTYGNGLFVAVASGGVVDDRVMTSPDGINWTLRTSPAGRAWSSVTYGNGLFVAVTTTETDRVMTSPDGITWTLQTGIPVRAWVSVTYGNGLFVAVSLSGVVDQVMTSPDGVIWTLRSEPTGGSWRDVTYGNGLFVAVGDGGTGNRAMTSPDGITWTLRTTPVDNGWYSVTYGNGLFVAVALSGTGDRVMTSPDGITWTTRTSTADVTWLSVTYGNGMFVAVSQTGTEVMTSGKPEINALAHNNILQGGLSIFGNVGIGITTPTYNLDVTGLSRFTGLVDASHFVATSTTATSTFAGNIAIADNSYLGLGTGGDSRLYYDGTDSFLDLRAVGTGDLMIALAGSFPSPDAGSVHIWKGDAGNVTAVSGDTLLTLENNGNSFISLLTPNTGESGIYFGQPTNQPSRGIFSYDQNNDRFRFHMEGSDHLFFSPGSFAFQTATVISTIANNNLTITAGGTGDLLLTADSDTFVGIGDTTPTYTLDVTGLSRFTGLVDASHFVATSTTATSTFAGGLTIGTSGLLVESSSGNVAIGTTTPYSKLTVWGDTTGNIFEAITSASSTALVVNSAGNVGIGTTAPSNSLSIKGTVDLTGTLLITDKKWIGRSDSSARLDFNYRNSTTTGVSPILSILDANFGVRNPFASYALDVAGTIRTGSDILQTTGGTFAAQANYTASTSPFSVAMGDVNNDGYADLAVANSGAGTVSVLINNGDGTFAAKVDYTASTTPYAVAIGDVNNDGYADLAVANQGSNTVSVLINNGDGTFATKVDYTAGTAPHFVAISDVDNDGYADLAVTNYDAASVSVFINNGDGTFATSVNYTTGTSPRSVAIGDINNDGYADLATANLNSTTVSVFINDGDGTFATKVDYPTAAQPFSVAIGDVNNDGYADLAVTNLNAVSVSVFINNGDGTFAAKVDYTTGTQPSSVAIRDINNDGYADLTVTNQGSHTVSVLINDGDGTFATKVDYPTGTTPISVAIGDVDNDGYADIAVANANSNNVSVFINDDSVIFIADKSTNRVAIGTSTPYSTLTLWGSASGNIFEAVTNASSTALVVNSIGNVGIGTTSPWRTLSVTGTVAFDGLTSSTAGDAVCITTGKEIVDSGGSTCALSSERFKENIRTLDAGGALTIINQLRVVSFDYKEEYAGGEDPEALGLIAEEVELVDTRLVDYDYEGLPLTLHFERITGLTVQAIQELNLNLEEIASTTASSTPESQSFAAQFFSNLFAKITDWFADATNGITKFFAEEIFTSKIHTDELCVGEICVTEAQLKALLEGQAVSIIESPENVSNEGVLTPNVQVQEDTPFDSAQDESEDSEAPVITVNGNNPAEIEVGASYTDLGATVTDNIDDNLGIYANVNGVDVGGISNISIDTTEAGEHTIIYSATDQARNTGTAERTVIVGDPELTEAIDGGESEVTEPAIDLGPLLQQEDTTPPTISLLGEPTVEIEVGADYSDAGAEASDDTDGNITASIIVINPVDITTAGEYMVTYNVTDSAGNSADEVTRLVTVIATPDPVAEPTEPATATSTEEILP